MCRSVRDGFAALGLVVVGLLPGRAEGQAVGFAPGVSSLPDGVALSATPTVSADRRYVRLSLGVGFQTIDGFQNFPVPAAVGGGFNRGAGAPLGFRSVMDGGPIGPMASPDLMVPFNPDYFARRPAPRPTRAARAKAARTQAPLPDVKILPSKKAEPVAAGPKK